MIKVEVKPRQDNLFDIWVHAANGELLLHSSQGYDHAIDAENVARLLFGTRTVAAADGTGTVSSSEPVALRVTYRDGKTKTEQLR
jgi:uncharacterized protein YegP (UPF0339 family)